MICIETEFGTHMMYSILNVQLVRQLQGQEENPFGDDTSTTPKKIFQLLNQVAPFVSSLSLSTSSNALRVKRDGYRFSFACDYYVSKVFQFANVLLSPSKFQYISWKIDTCGFQTIEALSSIPASELALRLYLQCAEVNVIFIYLYIKYLANCFILTCICLFCDN